MSTTRSLTNGTTSRAGLGHARGSRREPGWSAAAKDVFEQDGFLDARISDIAERAGLSHGSFYHYFDSKEEVFREVALEVDESLSAPIERILDPSSSATPYERIHDAIRLHLESYREEARIMGVIEQVSRFDAEVRPRGSSVTASTTRRGHELHPGACSGTA